MSCFVILLLSNEMQMSVRHFSAIPHLRGIILAYMVFAIERKSLLIQRFPFSQTPSSEPISYSQGKYTIPNWKGCSQFMMGSNICEITKPWM